MTKKLRQFRIEDELIERLDRYAEVLAKENPAFRVNRSAALRKILIDHLDRWEPDNPPAKKKRSRSRRASE